MSQQIKSIKTTRRQQYLDRFDASELKELVYQAEEKQFDEQGRLLLSVTWARPDEMEEKVVKSYDGHLITTEYFIDENEVSEKTVTEIDDKQNILKETMYYADGTESVSTIEYEAGKPVKKITMDIDEYERELSGEHIWQYDANGNLLKEEEREYGEIVYSREMAYNENDKMISLRVFHAVDPRPVTEEMEWEEENITHLIKTDIHGQKTENFYTMNEQGEIAQIRFVSDKYTSETFIEYDDRENAIHEKEINNQEEIMYEVFREFHPETNQIMRLETYINRQGRGPDVHYVLEYTYEFY